MSDDVGELPGMPEPYRLQRFWADRYTSPETAGRSPTRSPGHDFNSS